MSSYNKTHKLKFEDELPISTNVDFSQIGGLNRHICTLREMVIFPLIYKNVYEKFNIKPPRGILFHGPPGTGKTLVAKALATECAKNTQLRVSFFSRKGSDILDKWVGESERKLRTLFEKAINARPAVIFFDEIDALAPIRCSRQDQVHTSVVATLLALMDGLDTAPSGGIVIIGATNRINAIDPALRRTGRFDRELYFPLPCKRSRFDILQIITQYWQERPTFKFLKHLADHTTGYCGSDLQALCSDAVLSCLKRYYPIILQNTSNNSTNNSNVKSKKLLVNLKKLHVEEIDFINAQNNITPMSRKCRLVHYRLSHIIEPLLIRQLDEIVNLLKSTWTHFWNADYQYKHDDGKRYIGRIIILGNTEQGHTKHIAPALLHHLEHLPTQILDVQEIHENTGNRPVEEIFIEKFRLARQCCPSILYTPSIDLLWDIIDSSTKAVFLSLLYELDPEMPLLIITTSALQVPIELQEYFSKHCSLIYRMSNPNVNEREEFFAPLFLEKSLAKPPIPASSVLNETNVRFNKNQKRCSRRLRGLEAAVTSGTPDEKMNLQQQYRKRSIHSNNYSEVGGKRVKTEKIETNEIEDELKLYHNTVKIHSSPAVIKLEQKEDSKLKDQEQKQYHQQQLNNNDNNIDITISRPKLLYLYQHAVKDLTINTSCVSLELLYDKLNSCIQTYQYIWNRHSMLEKIEKILIKHEEVIKHYKVDNLQHFEGDVNSI